MKDQPLGGGPSTWNVPNEVTVKFPSDWMPSPNKKKIGTRWHDPSGNGVRIDKAVLDHNLPSQRVDHVVVRKNGQIIGRDGKPISGSLAENAELAHIPLSEYITWSTWYVP